MKLLHKIIAFCALLGIGQAFSYEYDFSNFTDMPLLIKIKPWGVQQDYYQIIKPDAAVKQVWQGTSAGGACLGSVSWAQWRGTDQQYKYYARDRGRIPNEMQREFGDKIGSQTAMLPMELVVTDSETFAVISKAASDLAAGIDSALCQALSTAKDFTEVGAVENIVESFGPGGAGAPKTPTSPTATTSTSAPARPSTPAPTTAPTKLDLEGSVVNTSVDVNPDTAEGKCSFGLGKLIGAAAKIAGQTMCEGRPFGIFYKIDPKTGVIVRDSRTRKPVLQAVTVEGE